MTDSTEDITCRTEHLPEGYNDSEANYPTRDRQYEPDDLEGLTVLTENGEIDTSRNCEWENR